MTQAEPPSLPGPALLFCPADRPDRYSKALAAADGVILDLEDGVGADAKDAARAALVATDLDPARVIVRVNATGTPEHAADIAALRGTGYRLIMLPKSETRAQLDGLGGDWRIVALCETALGIVNAAEIAAASSVIAVMWGAEDLIASLGGRTSRFPDGRYRDVARHARSVVLLAASAHGRPAIDAVYVNIPDLDGLAAESQDAAASGFTLKGCIHPSQVAVVRRAFQAGEAQVAWARRVLAAARDAGARDKGAIKVDGQMIDAPLIRQAEAILASVR
ncbi:MAG: citrate lyase subunit beta / citryl-CoA lyase [Trebonia sp.]|nr:citrate lyase subunit beta / citryl-CoA lyase [Trebonia sp.]